MAIIKKNKYILIALIILFITVGYFKIREYYTLKDAFVFSKDNIVRVWTVNKDSNNQNYNYDYNISQENVTYLSKLLSNAKLEKSSVQEAPPASPGNMVLFLDGNVMEDKNGTEFDYKRSISLSKINNEKMYVILEINKLRDDDSFNMENVLKKFYTINSKELVKFIENIDSN